MVSLGPAVSKCEVAHGLGGAHLFGDTDLGLAVAPHHLVVGADLHLSIFG